MGRLFQSKGAGVNLELKSLEELHQDFIESYCDGEFVEGVCGWNGDDALMNPSSFAERFRTEALKYGHRSSEIEGFAIDLKEWCEIHLGNLESKFR